MSEKKLNNYFKKTFSKQLWTNLKPIIQNIQQNSDYTNMNDIMNAALHEYTQNSIQMRTHATDRRLTEIIVSFASIVIDKHRNDDNIFTLTLDEKESIIDQISETFDISQQSDSSNDSWLSQKVIKKYNKSVKSDLKSKIDNIKEYLHENTVMSLQYLVARYNFDFDVQDVLVNYMQQTKAYINNNY